MKVKKRGVLGSLLNCEQEKDFCEKVAFFLLSVVIVLAGIFAVFIVPTFAFAEYIDQPLYDANNARAYVGQTFTSGNGWLVGSVGLGSVNVQSDVTVYLCQGEMTNAAAATFGEACISNHLASGTWSPAGGVTSFYLDEPILLANSTVYTLFIKNAPSSLRYYAHDTYAGGNLVACTANNSECFNGSGDWLDLQFQLGAPDEPEYTAEIYMPQDGEGISQATINAAGSGAYYFGVTTNISQAANPGIRGDYEINVFDDVPSLRCKMSSLSDGNAPDGTNYGTNVNHLVDGDPDPCHNFTLGDYTVAATVDFDDLEFSTTTATIAFTVSAYSFEPEITCDDDPSFLSPCWVSNLAKSLFWPSESRLTALFESLQDFGGSWPFSWFTGGYNAFVDATDQEPEDLGEAGGGNFLVGAPNAAWYVAALTSLYGDWAGGAMAAFIWIGAFIAIGNAGKDLLNIKTDEEIG